MISDVEIILKLRGWVVMSVLRQIISVSGVTGSTGDSHENKKMTNESKNNFFITTSNVGWKYSKIRTEKQHENC